MKTLIKHCFLLLFLYELLMSFDIWIMRNLECDKKETPLFDQLSFVVFAIVMAVGPLRSNYLTKLVVQKVTR